MTTKICPKCSVNHTKDGKFCSRQCANSRGPRTQEFKEKVSKKLKGRPLSLEHVKKLCGDNHPKRRNKNLPEMKTIIRNCDNCSKKLVYRTSGKVKKFCNRECYLSFCKTTTKAFVSYKKKCQFTFNVYDYPEEFDLNLIEEYGWYSPTNKKNNLSGISRDHKISIKYGFENSIDPYFISHPVNCRLMLHADNNRKKMNNSITLDELKINIDSWNQKYGAYSKTDNAIGCNPIGPSASLGMPSNFKDL